MYWYWGPVEAATRGFEASKDRCRRYMRTLPSAILVAS